MTVEQMDVTSAYLNGTLPKEIYMEKPELLSECLKVIVSDVKEESQIKKTARELLNCLKEKKDLVCRLNKAIYGLRQAGRQWHNRLSQKLKKMGFKSTVTDPCVYYSRRDESTLFMITYVDDMLIISRNVGWIAEIKRQLANEFEIKDLGKAQYCLGIEIEQTSGTIVISQKRYILDLLERF
ncbi:Retrovirus-related Pol polyprotein from transposon TNT 1-94 [Anthophora quadrimaculata]